MAMFSHRRRRPGTLWRIVAGIATLTVVVAFSIAPVPPAMADEARLRLDGAAVSDLGADLRVLAVGAQADDPGSADGAVSFVHVAPGGVSHFVGAVTCLRQNDLGQVQLSGQVLDGVTAGGVVLTGKDFFFTLVAGDGPQAFSLPAFADAGVRGGCSGGGAQRVAVTHGGVLVNPR